MNIKARPGKPPQLLSNSITDKLMNAVEGLAKPPFPGNYTFNNMTNKFKFCYAFSPLYRIPVDIIEFMAERRQCTIRYCLDDQFVTETVNSSVIYSYETSATQLEPVF